MKKDLGSPIAYGRTSEIYAWQDGLVLKLFYNWFKPEYIDYEAGIAFAAHAGGLKVPAVQIEPIHINNRVGLLYQRVYGDSIESTLAQTPLQAESLACEMANLHLDLHVSEAQVNFPSQRDKLARNIKRADVLPSELQTKTLALLDTMPDGNQICHGDFHPGNIMTTAQDSIIVDWMDASIGNPIADVARSTILMVGGTGADNLTDSTKDVIKSVHDTYLQHYFREMPQDELHYKKWLPIVAAARLSEGITELDAWLIAQVEKGLQSIKQALNI